VPVAPEVAAFEREIGGDEEFVMRGRGKDGAVIAYAEAEVVGNLCSSGNASADVGDEGEFSGWGSAFRFCGGGHWDRIPLRGVVRG
jgi:hypothetical protein